LSGSAGLTGVAALLEVQHKAGDCLGDVLVGGGALDFRKDLTVAAADGGI
jgi:hypothetical protein